MSGTRDYEVGKGKPPKHTRFGAGNNANPAGKTSEQKRLEYANAEAAMRIRERILRAAEARLVECSTEEVLAEFVEAAMLKLLKDSEDRGLGSPVQAITNPDGTLAPRDHSAAIIAALDRKHRDAE
jgi:hypothetical protein